MHKLMYSCELCTMKAEWCTIAQKGRCHLHCYVWCSAEVNTAWDDAGDAALAGQVQLHCLHSEPASHMLTSGHCRPS